MRARHPRPALAVAPSRGCAETVRQRAQAMEWPWSEGAVAMEAGAKVVAMEAAARAAVMAVAAMAAVSEGGGGSGGGVKNFVGYGSVATWRYGV